MRVSVAEVNEAVLQAIEEHALTPEAVEAVIALTERDDLRERQELLARELATVERQIDRLTDVIAKGGDAMSLVAKVRALESRRVSLARELPACAVLQRVLVGRVTFTPDWQGGYTFAAPTRYDRLSTGLVAPRPAYVPEGTTGWDHLRPEDTLDARLRPRP